MICFSFQGMRECGKCDGNLDSCLGTGECCWAALLTVALFSDHLDCGGISCSRTRWVVKSSMAGWLRTDITWICKVYPAFSPVKHWKWVSPFPSFLWPYKMYFSLLVIISYLEAYADTSHPPPLSILPGLLLPCSWARSPLWPPAPGSAMTQQGWFQLLLPGHRSFEPGPPTSSCPGLSPTPVGVSNGQGWSWAEEMMKYDEAYPCPGFRGITRLETARIGFSKETDGSLGEGKPTGILPS